ncbi:MAG TPA: hypothetical protein VF598_07865 [Hymenobacter sp.]|jgi:hypothetical protein
MLPTPSKVQVAADDNPTQASYVYMRPNTANTGSVPSQAPVCNSPDIWVAGIAPVADFQTVLATSDSYALSSASNVVEGLTNYIYVRGMNGSGAVATQTVQLYYAPDGIIQWPSEWQGNVIKTDQGNAMANITNLAAGAVGVADQPFMWTNVAPPPAGSDHYCLFAQFNDPKNPAYNPFPQISSQVDMAALVSNNLAWGWRNITLVDGSEPKWSYITALKVPAGMPSGTYFLYVNPTGFDGWSVSFQCSQTDANGKSMNLDSTNITQDNLLVGIACTLNAGFSAIVTINIFSNGNTAASGASVPLGCSYGTQPHEEEEVLALGIVDHAHTAQVQAAHANALAGDASNDVTPQYWLPLGTQTYQIK